MQKNKVLHEFIDLSRDLSQQVEAAVAAMLSETSITVRMRAVLEMLNLHGATTVPGVARQLGIQRQYVQLMMNELQTSRLVTRSENPAHKRSDLYEISDIGRQIIKGISSAEEQVVGSLSRSLTLDEAEKAHHVMEHLLSGFRALNTSLKE